MNLLPKLFRREPRVEHNHALAREVIRLRYMIATAPDTDSLVAMVESFFGLGWRPAGGLCESGGKLHQAMVMQERTLVPVDEGEG